MDDWLNKTQTLIMQTVCWATEFSSIIKIKKVYLEKPGSVALPKISLIHVSYSTILHIFFLSKIKSHQICSIIALCALMILFFQGLPFESVQHILIFVTCPLLSRGGLLNNQYNPILLGKLNIVIEQ